MSYILRKLSEELIVVLLIGLVSTTTAWTAIQASFHNNASSAADAEYRLTIAQADNLYLTAEVKYRADSVTWETGVAGSSEYWTYAPACKEAAPDSQLANCKAYMDASYNPYTDMWNSATPFFEEAEIESGYSNRLQVLTGIFAVALFALGVTSPMKSRKSASYLVAFAAVLWVVGIGLMVTIPIILL